MAQVSIIPINESRVRITLSWEVTTFSKEKEDGAVSCYIPAFDIYFSAPSKERATEKSRGLVQLFTDHFMKDSSKKLKGFALHLHRLGFKANNDNVTMMKIVKNQKVKANFKSLSPIIPTGFGGNEVVNGEMEVALP